MSAWVWDSQRAALIRHDPAGPLRLADSWLVLNGQVRSFERHRARFQAGARQVGSSEAWDPDFWRAVIELLPHDCIWFPRVEIVGEVAPSLVFRLRPAPERLKEARVWIPPFTDPRLCKELKGPDLPLLGELRDRARREHHCDEVLLLDDDGFVVEAANSNILWWDGDTLCIPDPELAPFEGVTVGLIVDEAARQSVAIEARRVRPEDICANEIWLTSALHGIRRVTRWSGRSHPSEDIYRGETLRFGRWSQWLTSVSKTPTV